MGLGRGAVQGKSLAGGAKALPPPLMWRPRRAQNHLNMIII